jgi:1,4-dihydroxy-2-naphthoyl-CoA hydrolase
MDTIWYYKDVNIDALAGLGKGNMGEHLGMAFEEVGPNYLVASMPVDYRTKQPYGLLHGGASVALAETIGSVASGLIVNPEKFIVVGLEINANHLKSVREGRVFAHCAPLHIGASSHVWDIRITNEKNTLVCIARLTVAVLKKPQANEK